MVHRVLYITPFSFGVSGADESLVALVSQLTTQAIQAQVLCPLSSPYKERFAAHVPTHTFPLLRVKRTKNPLDLFAFLLWLPIEVAWIFALILKERIDLVHINMESSISGALAARLAGRPCVIHYRGKAQEKPKLFFDLYLPLLSRLAHHVIAISQASAQSFVSRGLGHSLTVLYNPLPRLASSQRAADSAQSAPLQAWPQLAGKRVIACVGRLDPQKRIVDFLDGAARVYRDLPDVAFVVIGGDLSIDREREYKQLLDQRQASLPPDLPFYFLGRMNNIPEVLTNCALLVMPAVDEGFGRVVVEAMAAGCPVVAARSGAFPEILDQGRYGKLFEPCKPDDLARVMREALGDSKLDLKRQEAQHYALETFSAEAYVSKLSRLYDTLRGAPQNSAL